MAKATFWINTDTEGRKRGDQTGLDTLVVHAVTMSTSCWIRCKGSSGAANALSTPPGDYGRKAKLKGIDGDPHKRWSMWFNSMQREEPYLVLTSCELSRDRLVPSGTQ